MGFESLNLALKMLHIPYGKSKGKCMIDKKFKHIDNVVGKSTKHILNSLKVKSDDSDLKLFYTPPQSPSKPNYALTKSRMNKDHGQRHLKILLDAHEAIVHKVVIT